MHIEKEPLKIWKTQKGLEWGCREAAEPQRGQPELLTLWKLKISMERIIVNSAQNEALRP